jgi:hypothetical protein
LAVAAGVVCTFSGVSRRLAALACIGFAASAAGCGDGREHLIGADALRDCLAKRGASFGGQRPGATGYAPLFHLAPDLQGRIAGSSIGVFIERSSDAALHGAADARGTLGGLGISNAAGSVLVQRNAVVVFEPPPSNGARDAVRSCLEAG